MSFLGGTDPGMPTDPMEQMQGLDRRSQVLGMLLQGRQPQGVAGILSGVLTGLAANNLQNQRQDLRAQVFQGPQQNGAMPMAGGNGKGFGNFGGGGG